MLSVSTQSFAQDAKKVDELTKIIAENKNNPAATKAVVKNYMKLNKKDAVAVAALGKAFLNLDDMTNATEYANLAIKANKHHAAGYLLRGDIAVAKDNGGEAATWYQNAMLMAPNTPEGYIKYARIYSKSCVPSTPIIWLTQRLATCTLKTDNFKKLLRHTTRCATLKAWKTT